ncbi:hypothetical protein SUGI_0973440 [Cryptomeria japonica]|nr:hypothetical protein SUGI_0973440 [Cryptomeria japonica]
MEDKTTIVLSDSVVDHIVSSMNLTLVGRFFSFRPSIEIVCSWVAAKWKLKGSVMTSAISGGLFPFKFTMEEDLIAVLTLGPWCYDKHHLSICRWKSGSDLAADLHKTTPVWVWLSSG